MCVNGIGIALSVSSVGSEAMQQSNHCSSNFGRYLSVSSVGSEAMQPDPELLMCSTRTLNYAPKEEQKWMPHSTIPLHFQTRPFANRFLLPNPADLRLYSELPTPKGTRDSQRTQSLDD